MGMNNRPPNMALQRPRRFRLRSGRSLRSLGSPLNARSLGGQWEKQLHPGRKGAALLLALAIAAPACRTATVQPAPYVAPSSYPATTPEAEQRNMPVSPADLRILEMADALLSDPSRWNRHDDRSCTPEDTTWSLFCALQRASIEVLGSYDHRRVALQEVRFAIEEAASGAVFEHRLRDYNNLQTTSFQDVKAVLHVARDRVAGRLAPMPK